ncbi:MAG: primosomal protein N' [Clostridia bacterium]|nr:primosomal protein N' [Clostridia bacterium]
MFYEVIVDISNSEVDKVFDYHAPFNVEVGHRVLVPFGRRQVEGFVVAKKETSSCKYDVKDIILKLDEYPVILPEMIELARYMATKNLRLIDCLRLFIPAKLRGGRIKVLKKNYVSFNTDLTLEEALSSVSKSAKAQRAIVIKLEKEGIALESEINAEYSPSAVKALVEKGILIRQEMEENRTPFSLVKENKVVTLTDEQQTAVNTIKNGNAGTYLIHGVTGSGKTEIYMNVIESALNEGKTAIMLVPEISLTPQMHGLFRARFGDKVSVLHSGLSDGERYDEWRRLLLGQAKVALGARSAVFAPLKDVGIIIIDEEHDNSYVSESNPRYFTSDVAEFRAKHSGAKLILGSATPSLESYHKAMEGEYTLITLKNRANKKQMPVIETVDMRDEIRLGNTGVFSACLVSALEETLKDGNQAMLFLNRRGFASFKRCRNCGFVPKCPNCDVSLTYHQEDESLRCHYCGAKYRTITKCPKCGYEDLKEGKTGTEKVVDEVLKLFPSARVLRMDNDTTKTKDSYVKILSDFGEGKADILVGTQMIAKGHDFKNVTLVGIIDADLSLYYSDYRSSERTFQLITQVAGRAGREQKPGRVIMQTYSPRHYVYGFAKEYNYEGFYTKEINSRELTKYPPFTKIVRLLVLSENQDESRIMADRLTAKLVTVKTKTEGIRNLQKMTAPLKKLRGFYRYQIVIWLDADKEEELMPIIYAIANEGNTGSVSVFSEINPQQML